MNVQVSPDAKAFARFHNAVRELGQISGKDFETVIKSEMGAVLNGVIRATPKAKVGDIKADHAAQEFASYSLGSGKKRYKLGNRYPDELWSQIKERRDRNLKQRLAARGLAAAPWIAIAEKLGIPVKAAGYIRKAKGRKVTPESVVDVAQSKSGDSYVMSFVNAMTSLNSALNLGLVFRKALNARANYFSRAVKLTAQKKIKNVLDRYPGLGRVS